ncbi:hypothetical protein [Halolamina rubra]|uniref:hypothetical protein n=1 Tax=Halolamina rubra TaxID=1380430 RepID=UPI000678B3C5|nr:hypothetical protein [Halolamina rubra]
MVGLYGHEEGLDAAEDSPADSYEDWPDEHRDAADGYVEVVDSAPEPEDVGLDTDHDPLSWSDISPSQDPDLLAKIATYFEGMDADEPSDLLRAKCRLLDVDLYAKAQTAARQELLE